MAPFYLIDEEKAKKVNMPEAREKMSGKMLELFPIGCAYYEIPVNAKEPRDLKLCIANVEFFNSLGYTREDFEKRDYQLFAILMGDNTELLETMRKAIANPNENYQVKITTLDHNGNYHHVFCRFSNITLVDNGGLLCVETFGVETLFKESAEIYEELIYHADRVNRQWYLVKGQPGAVGVLDINSRRIVDMNTGMAEELGIDWEQLRSSVNGVELPIHKEDKRRFATYFKKAIEAEKHIKPCEVRMQITETESKWFSVGVTKHKNEKLDITTAIIAVWNIDHLKRVEEQLSIQVEQHNLLKDIYEEHLVEYDFVNKVTRVPKEFILRKGMPYEDGAIPEEEFLEMMHPDDAKYAMNMIYPDNAPIGEKGIIECRLNMAPKEKKAAYEWFRIFFKRIMGADGKLLRIVGRTVSIQKDKEKTSAMEARMRIDPLTMTLNKSTVETEIQEFLASEPEGTHALMLIDVDNFKAVNDNFGHLYGDAVLKSIAENIRGSFRSSDLVGRVGGDEFLVCMKDAKPELARNMGDELCATTKRVLQGKERDITISCSIGIAMYPETGTDYETLFKRAEYAMYQAKRSGKNKAYLVQQWGPEIENDDTLYVSQNSFEFERTIQTDKDFIRMSMELLTDCKDLNAGMELLLERVAERYSLSAISVFRYENEKSRVIRTTHWTKEEGIDTMGNRILPTIDAKRFLRNFDENGRYWVNDASRTQSVLEKDIRLLDRDKIASFICTEYDQSVSAQGCIMFQCDRPRVWSEGEKYFFTEFSKIFSVFLVLRDRLKEDDEEIARIKNRDHLTGLMTEEAFSKKVMQRVAAGKKKDKYYIISGDIMGFSYVNENFGTEAGNRVLLELARMMKGDEKDFLVCRQFSDFFAAFVHGVSKEALEEYLKRLEQRFARMAHRKYPMGGLRLCLGVYEWTDPIEVTLSSALENASIAKKNSKSMGVGLVVHYDEDMRKLKSEERRVLASFPEALEAGDILTYLQPKFNMKTGEIVGAEALCRWLYNGKIHTPGEFIDALERIGYIMELDFYMYEACLKTLADWRERGYRMLPISINFSKRHFDTGGIAKKVIELADKYEIPHEYIIIELTESVVERQTERVLEEINYLRENGFAISIDDFGTGYSSLNMLLHIPVDEVKVDKSFLEFDVCDEKHASNHRKFMRVLSELLSVSNDRIVCEGVETKQQAMFLAECGYTVGQGYLVDRPIPIREFETKYCKKN